MKIGIIGAGKIGMFHAATVSASPKVGETLIYDVDLERAGAAASSVGAQSTGDLEEIFRRCHAVVICSPASTHLEMLEFALSSGTAAFCEKPIGVDLDRTAGIVARIDASQVPIMIGFQRRADRPYIGLRELVAGGGIGKPYHWRMVSGDDQLPEAGYVATSGGILLDQSIHDFDILRWVSGGEIREIFVLGSNLTGSEAYPAADDFDNITVSGKMSDDSLFSLTGSRFSASGYDIRMEAAGSKGIVGVGSQGGPAGPAGTEVFRATSWQGGFLERFASAYRQEIHHFLDFASGKAANLCSARDALIALLAAQTARESLTQGRPLATETTARRYGISYEA